MPPVLPEDAGDVDGGLEYQLKRARILEAGYTGEYWYETAGFQTELSNRDCGLVGDILQMFQVITHSIDHLKDDGIPVDEEIVYELEFKGFDHNDALEGHMASYVEFLMQDDRWAELQPQLDSNDNGNSHSPALDVYSRMLSEYRRIKDSRRRGSGRWAHLLSLDDLHRIVRSQTHPSHRQTLEA